MNKVLYSFFLFCYGTVWAVAQSKSPAQFLEYPLGSRFTTHDQVTGYFKYIAATSTKIKLIPYGKSYEGKELMVAVVSSKDNLRRLESIRQNNLALTTGRPAKRATHIENQPAMLWLSYNVHGNEASSTETAMKMLYTLTESADPKIQSWLSNTVVIIDPCLNPDGRERYISHYNAIAGAVPNPDPDSREHFEPWPGGRSNHYYFDLNRDWAWQSQIESQQRVALYQQWMPQVHIDFHEQNYNEPYYFAPAAEPVHQDISAWQRQFQVLTGRNNARHFDEQGWQYFTRERFDLLYPAYGDTYALYNGAVGMTYEQGGIRAGLAVVTAEGDTLTLKDRIDHHFTTGMSTLETVSEYAGQLVSEFRKYFEKAQKDPSGAYKSYVVRTDNLAKTRKLEALLKRNQIEYAYGTDRKLSGFNFETQKTEVFQGARNDLIVNLQQPRAVLVNVLMEPQTAVTDSNTYDITAWSLPYAFGMEAYAVKDLVKGQYPYPEEKTEPVAAIPHPYAWILPWKSLEDAMVLIALQKANIKVRVAEQRFATGGKNYEVGTLLIYRAENERIIKNLSKLLADISLRSKKIFIPIASGYVDSGKDFGSSVYPTLSIPKVAIVSGSETEAQSLGEVWHFFEQELRYPLSLIDVSRLENLDIRKTTVLIVPNGNYKMGLSQKVEAWINNGGKIILLEDAISSLAGKKPFDIRVKEVPKTVTSVAQKSYASRNSENHDESIPGAIFKVDIDPSNPLTLGLGKLYYTLKTDDKIYEPLEDGWNAGMLRPNSFVAGLAGKNVKSRLNEGMLYGVQSAGKGKIIYLGTNVLFRSFWENGKQIMANAVFMVN
jgi:hypothetical protein